MHRAFFLTLFFAVTVGLNQSGASVSGVITDVANQPIPGADMSLYSVDRILQTKSDKNGVFRFINVPIGTYQLESASPGFKLRKMWPIEVTNTNAPLVSLTMEVADAECAGMDRIAYASVTAGKSLKGIVIFDSKVPIPNAEVQLVRASETLVLISLRTNDKGEFLFDDLEPGRYILKVSHPGFLDAHTEVFWIARENSTEVAVEMLRQGFIRVCQ